MHKHFFGLPWILLVTSCGWFQKKEEEAKPSGMAVVGEVTSVHEKEGFVLFRRYGPGELLSGGLLSARSLDGRRAASLTLSPETLGRFYTADYNQEAIPPRKGDVVVLLKEVNDTESRKIGIGEMPEGSEKLKKIDPFPEEEILDSRASQRSR